MVPSQLNSRLGFINPGLTSMGFEKGLLGFQYLFSAISISQWPLWWRCLNGSEGVLDRFFFSNRNLGLNGGFVWFSFFEIAIDFSGRSVNEWFPSWKEPLNESGIGFFPVGNVGVWVAILVFQGCLRLGLESPEAALHSCLESRCVKGGLGGRSNYGSWSQKFPQGQL